MGTDERNHTVLVEICGYEMISAVDEIVSSIDNLHNGLLDEEIAWARPGRIRSNLLTALT
jgi:hypothetical protein